MYKPQFYTTIDREKIAKDISKEGFDPLVISNGQGFIYSLHQHPETKLLVFLEGSMDVKVGDKTYLCKRGDKLIIPGNTSHQAIVGSNGCTFFWSEKVV